MRKVDPLLLILTAVVGLSVLGIVARVLLTGTLGDGLDKLLAPGATMFGALVAAIVTSSKSGKKGGEDDTD